MTAPAQLDLCWVRQYVAELPPRTRGSAKAYHSLLSQFTRFVTQSGAPGGVSRAVIQSWFRHRAERFPLHRVLDDRAWLIDHFLDWLVIQKHIPTNPFAELRQEYGERKGHRILQALLSPDSETALEALRPVPRFASHLGAMMRGHVDLMRALGLRYQKQESNLLRFDRFLQRRADLASAPLVVLVDEWTKEGQTAQHVFDCTATGKIVAEAMARIDPNVKVPTVDRRLRQQAINAHRRPRILSEAEVSHLLAAARSWPSHKAPTRPLSVYTMLVMAYCAGLRLGEIVRLKVEDIDLDDQTVEIRETKFFKSRRLPLTATAMAALRDYLVARRLNGAPQEGSAPLFWTEKAHRGSGYSTVANQLITVFRRAGLKPASGRSGPRIHDLRHTFAVHRLTAWYREGIDPQARLPYLATYLGHKEIHSTLVYLTLTDELLQRAGDRFRSFGAKSLQLAIGGAECQ
jgi:site-specific recombinase XerD